MTAPQVDGPTPPPAAGHSGQQRLRVLIVEDSEFDARVVVSTLRQGIGEVVWRRVQTEDTLRAALAETEWDIVISDHEMPGFSAQRALEILQSTGRDLPFLIVSGGIGEELAVSLMKAGAHDFLSKGQLKRLVPAVERELVQARNRAARRAAQQSLRENEQRYRLLWQNSPDAILMMDPSGKIGFANPAASEVFGHREDELVGMSFAALVEMAPGELAPYLNGAAGDTRAMIEVAGRHRNGSDLDLEISFGALDWNGKSWCVAFIRDVSLGRRAERALLRNRQELELARKIQTELFPKAPPAIVGLDIAGASLAADETGGDYYDYFEMADGALGVVVADVCGHGLGPALIMAETRAYLRIVARNRNRPGEVLARANDALAADLADGDRFVTALFARVDTTRRVLQFVNAGHPPALLFDRRGRLKASLAQPRPPLGLFADAEYPDSAELPLDAGDVLVLLTDGIHEAETISGEDFGRQRIAETLSPVCARPAAEIVERLLGEVAEFSRGCPNRDDRTVVVVKLGDSLPG
ncbi:MAG: SpoIIE family protein phosphatase [Verrucomicrobia bacterium]|nr:SpoIIE family protein phosphatase [Verrucomicrobiota bacterium]